MATAATCRRLPLPFWPHGYGSSFVPLKCCTNNAAKLNESSQKRAGWVAWRSVRVEDVGDFGFAINMKAASCPSTSTTLPHADSLSNILIQEIEMKLLRGVKLIENI